MSAPAGRASQAPSQPDLVDARYYQVAAPRSLGEHLMIAARRRIYRDFLRYCRPGPTDAILDVGVSDVVSDGANMLEQQYPHPDRITGVGLGPGRAFRAAFPGVCYRQIEPNRPLPFADKAFAIATSNAVLEHVGSVQRQSQFVRELVRVAHRVFISVPNRYFPVEHHTAIPLLHYWTPAFAWASRVLGKSEWADETNLILMSQARLAAVIPDGANVAIGTTGIALGPFSSNLFACIVDGGGSGSHADLADRGPSAGLRPALVTGDVHRSVRRSWRSAENRSSPCGPKGPSYMSQDAASGGETRHSGVGKGAPFRARPAC